MRSFDSGRCFEKRSSTFARKEHAASYEMNKLILEKSRVFKVLLIAKSMYAYLMIFNYVCLYDEAEDDVPFSEVHINRD